MFQNFSNRLSLVPHFLLLGLAAYFPFEPFFLKFVPDSLYVFVRYAPEVILYSLAAYALFHWKRIPRVFGLLFLALLGVAVASALFNQTPAEVAVLGIRQIVRFILVAFIAVALQLHERFSRALLGILFGVLLFQGALGILQAGIGAPLDQLLIPSDRKIFGDIQLTGGTEQFWESGQRVFGTMGRYDQLGTFAALVLTLIIGFLYQWRHRHDHVYLLLLFAAALPAFLLTYSRASWFGLLLSAFVIGYVFMRDKRILWGSMSVAGLAGAYIFFSVATSAFLIDIPNQTIVHRFFEAFSLERWKGEYTAMGRAYFIVHTPLSVVAASPILGVGPGSYGAGAAAALHYVVQYEAHGLPFGIHGYQGHIDNNWFSLWGEIGTLGLALYIALIVYLGCAALFVFRHSSDEFYRAFALGYLGVIAAISFQAFLATYLEVRTLAFYFWLIGGLILVEHERLKAHIA